MMNPDQTIEFCKQCDNEEAVRLDDAYGVPVSGFCSVKCAIKHGYRPEVFAGAYETDGDTIEPDGK